VGHSPNDICSQLRGCFVIPLFGKNSPIIRELPEANVPKVGHGPKMGHGPEMGQNEFDCACVSVVFTFIPLFFYDPYSPWDMDVSACLRPGF